MIAISYRRDDSLATTGRLYDRLQAQFGKTNVFMDFDSIPAGVDFRKQIAAAIDRTEVVIAMIGPRWLGERNDAARRIDDPADFVRLEIARALERDIPVIPLLIGGAVMPSPDVLPADLKELAFRNALPLDSGLDFHNHPDRVISRIADIIDTAPRTARTARPSRFRPTTWMIVALLILTVATVIWLIFKNRTESRGPTLAVQSTPDIAIDRYTQLNGVWVVFEQVNKEHGGEEIIWNYEAAVNGRELTMRGRKTVVNEPGESTARRALMPDEKLTSSTFTLVLKGLQAEGASDEQDPNGHVYSTLKIQFSEDFKSLSGTLKTGGTEVSTLYGSKQ